MDNNSISNKYSDNISIKFNVDEKVINSESIDITDSQKELYKQQFLEEVNNKLSELKISSDIKINNISEFNSFVKMIKTNDVDNIKWISTDLTEFIDIKNTELNETLNDNAIIDINNNGNNFDYLNNSYDLEYEKTKFFLDINTNLKKYNIPSDIVINNLSEFDSFNKLVTNFTVNPLIPSTVTSWLNNPNLKKFVSDKNIEFNNLIDPNKNVVLSDQLNINKNLDNLKDILHLDSVPTLEQLNNIFNLPEGFDTSRLTNLLKSPNFNLNSLDDLKTALNLPDLKVSLANISNVQIPNISNINIPKLSSLTTGLNSDKMMSTLSDAMLKDFPESTPWKDVIKYQAAQQTKALFDQLSKMTFYIEPGEIKILSNGSPSTHQGQNINRIKIKLK